MCCVFGPWGAYSELHRRANGGFPSARQHWRAIRPWARAALPAMLVVPVAAFATVWATTESLLIALASTFGGLWLVSLAQE